MRLEMWVSVQTVLFPQIEAFLLIGIFSLNGVSSFFLRLLIKLIVIFLIIFSALFYYESVSLILLVFCSWVI